LEADESLDKALIEEQNDVESEEAKWYVVHAYTGQEERVRANLLKRIDSMGMHDKIRDVIVPMEDEIEIKDGKRRHVKKRIYPGYILVKMILTDEAWDVVRNTPGVTGFVGSGLEPIPLPESEVKNIMRQMQSEAPKIKVDFQVGENVRVIDGPFTDFLGRVDEVNPEKGKLKVLVNMFGRETPVELDLLQVEKLH
jgi:transcriptional antiterminator NusG